MVTREVVSPPRARAGRMAAPWLAWALLACAAQGCVPEPPPPSRVAYLKVVAQPKSTTVYHMGRFLGSARLLEKQPKALAPGVKYLTFKAPGYFPHDLRVSLPGGETVIRIKLRPMPQ